MRFQSPDGYLKEGHCDSITSTGAEDDMVSASVPIHNKGISGIQKPNKTDSEEDFVAD